MNYYQFNCPPSYNSAFYSFSPDVELYISAAIFHFVCFIVQDCLDLSESFVKSSCPNFVKSFVPSSELISIPQTPSSKSLIKMLTNTRSQIKSDTFPNSPPEEKLSFYVPEASLSMLAYGLGGFISFWSK